MYHHKILSQRLVDEEKRGVYMTIQARTKAGRITELTVALALSSTRLQETGRI